MARGKVTGIDHGRFGVIDVCGKRCESERVRQILSSRRIKGKAKTVKVTVIEGQDLSGIRVLFGDLSLIPV
jgi:hypothetical protein